jgi:hypothetical protein
MENYDDQRNTLLAIGPHLACVHVYPGRVHFHNFVRGHARQEGKVGSLLKKSTSSRTWPPWPSKPKHKQSLYSPGRFLNDQGVMNRQGYRRLSEKIVDACWEVGDCPVRMVWQLPSWRGAWRCETRGWRCKTRCQTHPIAGLGSMPDLTEMCQRIQFASSDMNI